MFRRRTATAFGSSQSGAAAAAVTAPTPVANAARSTGPVVGAVVVVTSATLTVRAASRDELHPPAIVSTSTRATTVREVS